MGKQTSAASKEAIWRSHLARYATSGKSIAAFCRNEAISEGNFYAWHARLRQDKVTSAVGHARNRPAHRPGPWHRPDDNATLMFFPEGQVRVFLYGEPTSMRRSFDGLYAIVKHHMGLEPFSGSLFAFVNRRATQIKVLYFDRTERLNRLPDLCRTGGCNHEKINPTASSP